MKDLPLLAINTSQENPWPISIFAEKIKIHIEKTSSVWIEGEIIEYSKRQNTSFLTLKDLNINCILQLTIWSSILEKITFSLEEGKRVVVKIKTSYWLTGGKLSIQVIQMHQLGEGNILKNIQILKDKLDKEGLFANKYKKRIPYLPKLIGLITGKDSDALKDVVKNCQKRLPSAKFKIIETSVQGKNAVNEICQAIELLDSDKNVDVIIIARGGGSVEDLLPFNDEVMIRKIFTCSTPVISAIGHEANNPIIDYVADFRASTPTDAAKVVPDIIENKHSINELLQRIKKSIYSLYNKENSLLVNYLNRPILKNPINIVKARENDINQFSHRNYRAIKAKINMERFLIDNQIKHIKVLSPEYIFKLGYAFIRGENLKTVNSIENLKVGEDLIITFSDGILEVSIKSIKEKIL